MPNSSTTSNTSETSKAVKAASVLPIDVFLSNAKSATGLHDFGSNDFVEALERLIDALNSEAQLSEIGKFQVEMSVARGLENRLQIENYIAENPDVLDQQIKHPIFIAGLPRTGTTALHHILNADPANHTLRLWEGNEPIPPPEEATYLTDPRIEKTKESVKLTEQFMPGFFKTHLMDAEAPDECHLLFSQNFMSVQYSAQFHIPSYANWLYAQELTPSYAYHKRQLQVLQHKKSGRWVLKTPYHQLGLPAILKVYPDAIIVQTHRAPLKIIGSGCSFSQLVRSNGSLVNDKLTNGRDWMDMLNVYSSSFENNRAELEAKHPNQFIDIDHDEFVSNPWPELEKIYAAADSRIDDTGKQAMQKWFDDNPQGKHGKHTYNIADYGISEKEIDELFGEYIKRYNLSMA